MKKVFGLLAILFVAFLVNAPPMFAEDIQSDVIQYELTETFDQPAILMDIAPAIVSNLYLENVLSLEVSVLKYPETAWSATIDTEAYLQDMIRSTNLLKLPSETEARVETDDGKSLSQNTKNQVSLDLLYRLDYWGWV